MSRFIESIQVKDGKLQNIPFHNERFNRTLRNFFPGATEIDLQKAVKVPETLGPGLHKCRVAYTKEIEDIEFAVYQPRIIRSLRIVDSPDIDYTYKYADRSGLEKLFEQR